MAPMRLRPDDISTRCIMVEWVSEGVAECWEIQWINEFFYYSVVAYKTKIVCMLHSHTHTLTHSLTYFRRGNYYTYNGLNYILNCMPIFTHGHIVSTHYTPLYSTLCLTPLLTHSLTLMFLAPKLTPSFTFESLPTTNRNMVVTSTS